MPHFDATCNTPATSKDQCCTLLFSYPTYFCSVTLVYTLVPKFIVTCEMVSFPRATMDVACFTCSYVSTYLCNAIFAPPQRNTPHHTRPNTDPQRHTYAKVAVTPIHQSNHESPQCHPDHTSSALTDTSPLVPSIHPSAGSCTYPRHTARTLLWVEDFELGDTFLIDS
ncbi:hypothetical protein Pcinc_009604 [Petrolisthes cinctipes]|uniref:Uncharacterized protein n=1 Tax=Petrolisthes cinctipes TaxID=88211 RepID=A0AAE1G6L1_PETCI|nr:hypothetical protein Pcinc_009604 [Petrolisthes cinctipes]